jgi:branched-chain amino acid transport system permease protein
MSFFRRHLTFITFAVVMMGLPFLVHNKYYLSVLAFTATRLMAVIGLNLLMGQAGQISLGHAAFIGLGAYGAAILTTTYGVNPWLAMLLAAVISGVIAGLIGVPTLKLKGHYLAMATLGFGEIVSILLIQLKGLTNGTDGIVGIPSLSLGPIDFSQPLPFHLLAWGVALGMLLLALNLSGSRTGRALRALHRAEVAASSSGVNTAFQKVQIFVVSAVFASIGGSLTAYYVQFISPDSYSLTVSVLLVTGVVVGGMASVWGAVWGTAVIMIIPEVLKNAGGGKYQDYTNLVYGVILILIMIFLPGGIVGWREAGARFRQRVDRLRGQRPVDLHLDDPEGDRVGGA